MSTLIFLPFLLWSISKPMIMWPRGAANSPKFTQLASICNAFTWPQGGCSDIGTLNWVIGITKEVCCDFKWSISDCKSRTTYSLICCSFKFGRSPCIQPELWECQCTIETDLHIFLCVSPLLIRAVCSSGPFDREQGGMKELHAFIGFMNGARSHNPNLGILYQSFQSCGFILGCIVKDLYMS